MNARKIIDFVIYALILPFTFLSFILTPLQNDTKIFIGVEYIADTFNQIPAAWDQVWEIKPIGNRILNWALYKAASVIAPISNPALFGIVVKTIALVMAIVVAWYFASKVNVRYTFPLTIMAFCAIGTISTLQPEWWASLAGLVAMGFLLTDNKHLHFITGLIFVCMGLLKGITAALIVPVLIGVWMLNPDARIYWKHLAAGVVVAAGTFLLTALTIFPNAIPNMMMSAEVARVGLYPWTLVTTMAFGKLIPYTSQMPVTCAGLFLAVAYFRITRKDAMWSVAFVTMWLVPAGMVVIQSELMIYHFFAFTIPALVTVVLWGRE
jgi:hypothetical protein